MTSSPPQVNGRPRPALPVIRDWQTVFATPTPEPVAEPESTPVAPAPDSVAEAEAEAIRIRAQAEAKATEIKAVEEARKLRIANDKAEARAKEEQAARDARMAEADRKREESERAKAESARQAEDEKASEAKAAKGVKKANKTWRGVAIGFYALCGAVALPVQISAFWDREKPWMAGAPVLLEVSALVVLIGAAAAVASRRPHWHFRLIAWVLAFIAAGVNLTHGLDAFDPATAIGTALASIFGPGVWDLHEHGRIRRRDGALTWKERRAKRKAEEKAANQRAVEQDRLDAEKKAADASEAERLEALAGGRAENFKKVWDHAEKLAFAMGETTVTEAIWIRAHNDIEGTDPGENVDVIRGRNAARRRLEAALENTRVNTPSKVANAQRAIQTPRSSYQPVPPLRKPKDTPRYHRAAGRAHGELLRRSTTTKKTSNKEQK